MLRLKDDGVIQVVEIVEVVERTAAFPFVGIASIGTFQHFLSPHQSTMPQRGPSLMVACQSQRLPPTKRHARPFPHSFSSPNPKPQHLRCRRLTNCPRQRSLDTPDLNVAVTRRSREMNYTRGRVFSLKHVRMQCVPFAEARFSRTEPSGA